MTEHTPGPWRFEENIPGPDGFHDDIVTDPRGFVVAEVPGESAGDGPLIAAAPDLLEACRVAAEKLDLWRSWEGDEHCELPTGQALQQVRAAIAKARGEGDDG